MLIEIEKLHTTEQGAVRIQSGLGLSLGDAEKVAAYCREFVQTADSFYEHGKNIYFIKGQKFLTVNRTAVSIITAGELRKLPIYKGQEK